MRLETKIFGVFLSCFVFPVGAIDLGTGAGMCGAYKYDNIYAVFEPISYTCATNEYLPKQTPGCEPCITGFTCGGGTFAYNENIDQGLTPIEYTCNAGYFLPAASETCAPCPDGWNCPGGIFNYSRTDFQGLSKSAIYMAGNENNVCAANYAHGIYAVFTPIDYVCDSGYFLPANSTTCIACPDGYSCAGGTFNFNKINSQGLTRVAEYYTVNEVAACAANFHHYLNAVFVKNIDCDAGNYLPANTTVCALCPANNYCLGGSYSPNVEHVQGVIQCPNNLFSPSGAASLVQCGRIMHVGDDTIYLRSDKVTTPSLNVKIGDEIFYANMTSTQTKMNKNSEHYFRARWQNSDYYVCDDTVCGE